VNANTAFTVVALAYRWRGVSGYVAESSFCISTMRIGIFGGSFDPIHYGHLLLAEQCREQCRLDEIRFLPASAPPHKAAHVLTEANHRIAMIQLGIAGHAAFSVSAQEIERGGISYTVETLRELRQREATAELFFLMGADSLRDLPTWREPEEICQLAIPVVVQRRGSPEPDLGALDRVVSLERLDAIRRYKVDMPVVEFSSSSIRAAVAEGRSIRYQLPRAVEKYIQTNGLYQQQESKPCSNSVTSCPG
jgi:nicotinate-nucleotide adenylyltransferase